MASSPLPSLPLEGGRLYELQPELDADTLLQEALDLLMHGDAAGAVSKARAVQTQATSTDQPIYSGWALWMIGLAHIYLNDGDQAVQYLNESHALALSTQQSSLAMAVYLAQQLISEHQHQTQLRQYVTRLLRELDEREARLTQQFRTMLKLATDTWIGVDVSGTQGLPPMLYGGMLETSGGMLPAALINPILVDGDGSGLWSMPHKPVPPEVDVLPPPPGSPRIDCEPPMPIGAE